MSNSNHCIAHTLSPEIRRVEAGHLQELDPSPTEIVGDSAAISGLRTRLLRLGPYFRTVLLRGEAGTGKELVARTLHGYSSHAKGPFVIFNCALQAGRTDPADEAVKNIHSLLRSGHRGTVYLKKVCKMTFAAQTDLLAVLQARERVQGRNILVHGLEAKIIASTTEDLRVLAAAGRFHEELYDRICAVEIELPPLRQQVSDIPVLAEHFLDRYGAAYGRHIKEMSSQALSQLVSHAWPGNVEELRHILQRAVMECRSGRIEVEHLHIAAAAPESCEAIVPARLQQVIEQHVFQVLRGCAGNKVKAAEVLGISRSTLYRMLDSGLRGDRQIGSL